MTNDLDLLAQFTGNHSQDAFTEVVRRHVNLVYSAALRQVRSPQLAEEVSQSVFTDLARNAGKLKPDSILTAWLYQVTRRTAVDVVRKESRRRRREQIAVEMTNMNATASDWLQIEPLLDDAMATLDETDRAAVLLRYFENKSLREVGTALGTTDDTAQKRVSRAVERLREFFTKRNVAVGAAGIAAILSANAVQAAPAGLSGMILSAAATSTLGMTMTYKLLVTSLTAAAVGLGVYTVQLQKQMGSLQQQQAALEHQIGELNRERDAAKERMAALQEENAGWRAAQAELLRLRSEVSRLQNQANRPDPIPSADAKSPWKSWNNNQKLGSFYAVAATSRETVGVGIGGLIATRDNITGAWNTRNIPDAADFRAVIYADNQYVVVGEGGSILTSPDGLEWTRRASPTQHNLLGLFWDGHQFLAGGDGGTLLASADGIDWTPRDSGSRINLYSFSYSGSRYVAVGNDGILISNDSMAWAAPATMPTAPFTASTWTGNEFLACGLGLDKNPTVYTSPDGETWTLRDTTITASLRAALTVNGAIYISGDSVVAKSLDGGTTWTNVFANPAGAMNKLFMGLASNGQFLIAAGFNHNVWGLPLSAP